MRAAAVAMGLLAWLTAAVPLDAIEPPRPKPDPPAEPGAATEPAPPVVMSEPAPPVQVDEQALAACERDLLSLGVRFERLEPIDDEGQCGVPAPYDVNEIADGVALVPDTELTCETALALARWVGTVVMPAVEPIGEGVRLTRITHASTYVCRHRNGLATAKISEHARSGAVDIVRFTFEGHDPIPIIPRVGQGDIDEAFQRAVRAGACLYFTTVLGPGSDEYHHDHLHLDLARRSRGYRLCQ